MNRYDRTRSALEWLSCCEYSQDQWIKYILCVKHYLGEDGRELAREWSMSDPDRFSEYAFRKAWDHSDGRENGEGALFGEAKAKGWNPVKESPMTEDQRLKMEESKAKAAKKIKELEEESRKKFKDAINQYDNSLHASGEHPYLKKIKKLDLPSSCSAIRISDSGCLMIPIRGIDGSYRGIQFISPAGKKWIFGSQSYGLYVIGSLKHGKRAWLCEGLATGITGNLATNDPVIVCFTADNMVNIAEAFKSKSYELAVLTDNDCETGDKGLESALKTGLPYSMPSFEGTDRKSGDWDDLRMETSLSNVAKEIRAQLKNKEDDIAFPCDISGVDLTKPPAFVGELAKWMESNGPTDTRKICAIGALYAVGAIGSLSHYDGDSNSRIKTNIYAFCLSPSGTGKDTVYEGINACFDAAGMAEANQGVPMSAQEIQRNLFDSQLGSYVIDEVGEELKLINNGGGHNSGMIKQFTAAFTKTDKSWSGRKTEFKTFLNSRAKDIARLEKLIDEDYGANDEEITEDQKDYAGKLINAYKEDSESYLKGNSFHFPAISMMGLSTPEDFNKMIDHEKIQNGFFGRTIIVEEFNDNPSFKKGFSKTPMPEGIKATLISIANGLDTEDFFPEIGIREPKSKKPIYTNPDAKELLSDIGEYFVEYGEVLRKDSALALARRGFEMVNRVSYILAMGEHLRYRTVEHVTWAFALTMKDIENKVEVVKTNSSVTFDERESAVVSVALKTTKEGELLAMTAAEVRAYSNNRKYGAHEIKAALEKLVLLSKVKVIKTSRGTIKYYR